MKTTPSKIAAPVLALVLFLAPAPRAEAVVFHDIIHTFQNIVTQMLAYYQRFDEYRAQATRWSQQLQHYQQELVKVMGFASSFNIPLDQNLVEVPETRMVAELCGGGVDFSVAGLLSAFTINPEGNILEQQRDVCRRIQVAKNRKYNATVKFMKELKPQLDSELKQLEARRNASQAKGNVDASVSDAVAFDNKLKVQFEAWEMQMKGYDAYIASMEDDNRTLAQIALQGKKTDIRRELIRTIALKKALAH